MSPGKGGGEGGTETEITEYVIPFALVASFKYLGRILSISDDDFPAVVHNILSGASEVGVDVQGVEQVGCVCPDLGGGLYGSGSGGYFVWVGDMGDDTAHWEGFERIPPKGGPQADGTTTSERSGRRVGVSPAGGNNGRDKVTGGLYLSLLLPDTGT